jgi:hypothetical protein
MNAFGTRSGTLLFWLAALGAVAALIGWETDWGRELTRTPVVPDVAAPPPVTLALLPDYRVEEGAESRQQTVERPVFVPTRRPAPPAVPTAQEAAKPRMQKGQFVLTGTAVIERKSIAFLRESAGGKSRSVRVGETINGLLVAEVKPDRVRLTMGEDSEELVLKVAAGPRTTAQPAAPPTAPGTPPPPGTPTAGRAAGPAAGGKPTDDAVPAAAAPGQAVAAPVTAESAETSLLERRRAARAAQAAAEAAARAGQTGGSGAPAPATQSAPPAADSTWSDVYRRMQQPRR